MQRLVSLTALLVAVTIAAGTVQSDDGEQETRIATAEVVIRRAEEIPADPTQRRSEVYVLLMPVAGHIGGDVSGGPIIGKTLREGESFLVSLDDVGQGLAAAAIASFSDSISFEPVETRVARLGTFAEVLNEPDPDFFTLFEEKQSKRGMFLIYVDRPCTLRGASTTPDGTLSVFFENVVLPRAGLHWIHYDDRAPGKRYTEVVVPDGDLVYVLDAVAYRPPKVK